MIKVRHFISTTPHKASQRRADDYYELLKTNTQAQSNHGTMRPTQTEKQTTKQQTRTHHGWARDVAQDRLLKSRAGSPALPPGQREIPVALLLGVCTLGYSATKKSEHHNQV